MKPDYRLYIDGQWRDATNGGSWAVIDPSTEEPVETVPYGDGADARAAIDAAASAFPAWSARTAYERAEILLRTANLIRARIDELYPVNISESGKTIADAKGDLLAAAALFEWFAEEGKRAYGRTIPSRRGNKRLMVLRQPVGVVGTITAWNFPAYNPARSWAAALAAGCTIVAKPSEYTPLTAMRLVALLNEAGLPPGVLNLVNGDPESIGAEMLRNPLCRKIAFTGSTRVGRRLMEGAAQTMTRLSLECGGNAPVIVFHDADMKLVNEGLAMAKCRNVGQVCVSPQRFLVHDQVRRGFVDAAVPQLRSLRIGRGSDPQTQVGPLINARQRDRVEELVALARDAGARVETGGARPPEQTRGFFYQPTLVSNVSPESPLFREEIFGPVMPVTGFDSVEEVLRLANATEYGLAAYVFTNDLNTAVRMYEGLEFGMIAVNDWSASTIEGPFPGWKQSGMGRECGLEGLEEYMETKLVGIGLGS